MLPQSLLLAGLLDIDHSLPIIFVLFIVLAAILNRLIFNPLLAVLDQREKLTTGSAGDIKHLLEEYDRRLNEYEAALNKARLACYQELENQRATAMKARTELLNTIKAETQAEIARTKTQLEAQVQAAQADLSKEAVVMAATISTAILGRQIGGVR